MRAPFHDERGQTSLLIIGFCVVLVLTIAMVVNASAAYLQRQGLDSVAEGAALVGADAGAEGTDVYSGGLDEERLALFERTAREAVDDYLASTGAGTTYPGLTRTVRVDAGSRSVRVQISAPLSLPFHLPGAPDRTVVTASGAAAVSPAP